MHEKLHDLRLLYLAHQIEDAFEGLERALHRHLPAELQTVLEPLFQGGANHRKLDARLRQLSQETEAQRGELTVQELLQALRDCERMARDFYLRHLDELSSPDLVQLFRGLAAEEGQHLEAVEQAITVASGLDYGTTGRPGR